MGKMAKEVAGQKDAGAGQPLTRWEVRHEPSE